MKKNGLTILYTPQQDRITADVVFVHGLQGDPQRTWQWTDKKKSKKSKRLPSPFGKQRESNSEKPESAERVFWPLDLLPKAHSDIRILTFGYDSKVTKGLAEPNSQNSIFEHGASLLRATARARSEVVPTQSSTSLQRIPESLPNQHRPIIFVAHSLGGLVVKQALIEARKQEDRDAGLFDVYLSTYAIIFFGTPHRGADLASWANTLRNIAKAAFIDSNEKIITDLMPSGTTKLLELRLDFNDVLEETVKRPRRLKLFTFQEELGLTSVKLFNEKVVPDFSSSFDSREYGNDSIHANHMNMCRFTGEDDDDYKKFCYELGKYLVELRVIFQETTEDLVAKEEKRKQDILRSLEYPGRESKKQSLQYIEFPQQTLSWIWSLSQGSESFSHWLQSDKNDIFWISGKPGSGKSTLVTYLAHHPHTISKLQQSKMQPWTIVSFFFDFRSKSQIANNFEGLLRSFLLQVFESQPDLLSDMSGLGQQSHEASLPGNSSWTEVSLRQSIEAAVQASNTPICIFVDGLDEYEGDMPSMVRFFREFANHSNVKLCIASRPEPVLRESFSMCPGFSLQQKNKTGIRSYAEKAIKMTFQSSGNDIILLRLASLIATRAEGVFLWARFAVDEVLHGYAEHDDEQELLQRLKILPDELEGIYERILKRLRASETQEGHLMLLIACYTKRPLNLQEFKIATDLAVRRDIEPSAATESESFRRFRFRLQAKTGGLLEVGREEVDCFSGVSFFVKVIHETVRAYLCRSNLPVMPSYSVVQPHALLLNLCGQYIESVACRSDNFNFSPMQEGSPQKYAIWKEDGSPICSSLVEPPPHRMPLLNYSANHVLAHARDLERSGMSSFPFLQSFLSGGFFKVHKASNSLNSGCAYCEAYDVPIWANPAPDQPKPVENAVLHGLLLYSQDAMGERNRFEVHDNNRVLRCAINFAVVEGYLNKFPESENANPNTMVQHVLDYGAQVQQNHLVEAFEKAPPSTLKLLLRHKSASQCQFLTENDETVNVLWIFAKYSDGNFRISVSDEMDWTEFAVFNRSSKDRMTRQSLHNKLKVMLEHTSDINEDCGPQGTVLQTLIQDYVSEYCKALPVWRPGSGINAFYEKCGFLLRHGADLRVQNQHQPPISMLQEALRNSHLANEGREHIQNLLNGLYP